MAVIQPRNQLCGMLTVNDLRFILIRKPQRNFHSIVFEYSFKTDYVTRSGYESISESDKSNAKVGYTQPQACIIKSTF